MVQRSEDLWKGRAQGGYQLCTHVCVVRVCTDRASVARLGNPRAHEVAGSAGSLANRDGGVRGVRL